jgi:hypothetical protein
MLLKKLNRTIKIISIVIFNIFCLNALGQDTLLRLFPNEIEIRQTIGMLIYNDIIHHSDKYISFKDYNCLINNFDRLFLSDTIPSRFTEITFLLYKAKPKSDLNEVYFRRKDDCLFECANQLFFDDNINILFPDNSNHYLLGIWGANIYKLNGFLLSDVEDLTDELIIYNSSDIEQNPKKRYKKLKKRKKRIEKELIIFITELL